MICNEYSLIGETVYSEQLPNGLSVFIVPKRGFHKYYAYFAANYGGVDNQYNYAGKRIETPQGVAHFLEHKMFDTADGDAMQKLSANGASPNAYTSADITAYHFDCVENFFENLAILLDFVSTPYFTPESVKKEQGIITQEILMNEDDPDYCLYFNLMKSLFRYSPLRDCVAGTTESIKSITAQTLYDCHKAFYTPSNMVLCVVGDIIPQDVIQVVRAAITEDSGAAPERHYGQKEPLQPVSAYISEKMDVSLPIFLAGCKITPAESKRDILKFELINALALELLAGQSSPLYFRLYSNGLISSDFSTTFESAADAAFSCFGGETREPEHVFDEVLKETQRVSRDGFDAGLFERIKKASIGSHIRMFNSFSAICGNMAGGHFRGYDSFKVLEMLSSINENDITSFIRDNFVAENMALSIILPREV